MTFYAFCIVRMNFLVWLIFAYLESKCVSLTIKMYWLTKDNFLWEKNHLEENVNHNNRTIDLRGF